MYESLTSCMSIHHMCAWCLRSPDPGTGVTDDSELPCECWEPSWVLCMLLIIKSSLQPQRLLVFILLIRALKFRKVKWPLIDTQPLMAGVGLFSFKFAHSFTFMHTQTHRYDVTPCSHPHPCNPSCPSPADPLLYKFSFNFHGFVFWCPLHLIRVACMGHG